MSFLEPYMARLDPIYTELEAGFASVAEMYPDRVRCRVGCEDCCHYPFDIRLVEAVRVCEGVRALPRRERDEVRRRAAEAMEALRSADATGTLTRGTISGDDIARRTLLMSNTRVCCPAVADHKCSIYHHRPGICRIFGVPIIVVRGRPAVVCHVAGFAPEEQYVSYVIADHMQRLDELDAQLMADLAGAPALTAFRTSVTAAVCVDYDLEKVRRVAVKLAGVEARTGV